MRKDGVIVELGQFMVTKVWKELVKPTGIKEPYPVWKIMLQTMDTSSKPWYWSENMQDANTIGDALHVEQGISNNSNSTKAPAVIVEEKACESCGKSNPQIFDNAPWVCLEDECDQFFQVSGKVLSQIGDDNQELRYSNDFINKTVIYDIVPGRSSSMFRPLPEALVEGIDIYGTEKALRAGLTCPKCWCCTARKYWDRLACCYCGFEYNLAPLPYPLSLVDQETKTHTKNMRVRNDGVTIRLNKDHVEQFVEDEDDGMSIRIVYMIKDTNGFLIGTFVIERPSDDAKKGPGGADELYTRIEAEGGKMKFQRNPARCPGSKFPHGDLIVYINSLLTMRRWHRESYSSLPVQLRKLLEIHSLCHAILMISRVLYMNSAQRESTQSLLKTLQMWFCSRLSTSSTLERRL